MKRLISITGAFFLAIYRNALMAIVALLAAIGPRGSQLQRIFLRQIGVTVKGQVYFGRGIILYGATRLVLGRRCAVGDNAHIACHAPIVVGDDFLAAPGLYLNSGFHDPVSLKGAGKQISIGNRVWCGARVTICAGVEIGDDVVIGAGSVVISSVPSNCIAAGVPAQVIRQIDRSRVTIESAFRMEHDQ